MKRGITVELNNCINTVTVSKSLLHDRELSLSAKGLLTLLFACPTDLNEGEDLAFILYQYCKEDVQEIERLISELEQRGYIEGKITDNDCHLWAYDDSLLD